MVSLVGMQWVLAAVVVTPVVVLVVGALRGQVQVRSCCSVDAAHDKRITAAGAPVPAEVPVRGDRAAS